MASYDDIRISSYALGWKEEMSDSALKKLSKVLKDVSNELTDGFTLNIKRGYKWRVEVEKNGVSSHVFAIEIEEILDRIIRAYDLHYIYLSDDEMLYIVENTLIPEPAYKFLLENTQKEISSILERAKEYRKL